MKYSVESLSSSGQLISLLTYMSAVIDNLSKLSLFTSYCVQGIIDSTGTETRHIFTRMFVMAKSFEELFTPIWNGIAVSVWYVSSTPVALKARLNGAETLRNEETRRQWCYFRSGTQTINSCRRLDYDCDYKSIIYVPMIYAGQ